MSEEKERRRISPISAQTREAIRQRTAYGLPNNPSERGMSAAQIKEAFWLPVTGEDTSVLAELDRVASEVNAALEQVDGDVLSALERLLATGMTEVELADILERIRIGIGDGSLALNEVETNIAGRRGYYYSHIDLKNKKIYLTANQVIPEIGEGSKDDSVESPAYEVGDRFSIVNSAKYEHTATISGIDGNVITYEGELPFTAIADATGGGEYVLEADDYSFSVPSKAGIGVASLKKNSIAAGTGCSSVGNESAGFGRRNLVVGDYGLGAGYKNTVGYCCIVGGTNNDSIANYSLVTGAENKTESLPTSVMIGGKSHTVQGSYGVTVGFENTVKGSKSIVGGAGNTVSGDESAVAGGSNTVTAARNVVGGKNNTVNNQRNLVAGESNTVSSINSSIVGNGNTATNCKDSVIGGSDNTVQGNGDGNGRHLVVGSQNDVKDIENIVGGENNEVSSARCIVGGQNNTVTAKHGLTVGTGNQNTCVNAIVGGKYAKTSSNALLTLGNGKDKNNPSNVFEVLNDGQAVMRSLKLGETVVTEEQLQELLRSTPTISGTWRFNCEGFGGFGANKNQDIIFYSNHKRFVGVCSDGAEGIHYSDGSGNVYSYPTVFNGDSGEWFSEYAEVDFGSEPQAVSAEFLAFMELRATKVNTLYSRYGYKYLGSLTFSNDAEASASIPSDIFCNKLLFFVGIGGEYGNYFVGYVYTYDNMIHQAATPVQVFDTWNWRMLELTVKYYDWSFIVEGLNGFTQTTETTIDFYDTGIFYNGRLS